MIATKSAAPAIGVAAPQVNLLPPAERERRDQRALVRRWGVIGLAVAVLLALVTLALAVREHAARSDLAQEQDRTTALARRLAAYGDVSTAVGDKSAYETFRSQVMGTDLSWHAVLGALQAQVPAGGAITGFDAVVANNASVTPSTSTGSTGSSAGPSTSPSPSPSPSPNAAASMGGSTATAPAGTAVTVTVTVTSRHPLDEKAMVAGFAKVPGVLGVDLGSLSSENFPDYTATTTVFFDGRVYSRRYVRTGS